MAGHLRWSAAALVALGLALVPPLVYLAIALALGLLAVNPNFEHTPAARGGVPVYVRTNGLHAEFVVPARAPYDWTRELPHATVVDARRAPTALAYDWIAFGWGDRDFFIHTPTWRELRPAVAWRALTAQGPAAMHVEYLPDPQDYRGVMLSVSPAQYLDLVAYVRNSFQRDSRAGVERIEHPGYFGTDAFFNGTGHYSAVLTSNEWVRRGLSAAGVRAPRWAPFDAALFWQLERIAPARRLRRAPGGSRPTRARAWLAWRCRARRAGAVHRAAR